jgi:hypothetical protein
MVPLAVNPRANHLGCTADYRSVPTAVGGDAKNDDHDGAISDPPPTCQTDRVPTANATTLIS